MHSFRFRFSIIEIGAEMEDGAGMDKESVLSEKVF